MERKIEEKIDITISELSEIYPVFAYELSGQYKIKERLEKSEQYFEQFKEFTEEIPFDIKEWVQPKLTKKLIDELDTFIIGIAKKIGRKTKNEVLEMINRPAIDDNGEMEKFINEYIEKIKTMANKV